MTVSVGDHLRTLTIKEISPEVMKAWAGFLQDPNPIHLDPSAVRAKGLGERVINQGPCNVAYVISMLQSAFPNSMLEGLEVRYVDNVYAGDTVEAGGKVTVMTTEGGMRKVTCEIWLRAVDRGPVIAGTATMSITD